MLIIGRKTNGGQTAADKPASISIRGSDGKLHPISLLYLGAHKIWQAVSSCFGSGYWRQEQPWKDTDAWRNN